MRGRKSGVGFVFWGGPAGMPAVPVVLGLVLGSIFWWSGDGFAQAQTGQRQTTGTINRSQGAGLKGDAVIQYDEETGSLIIVTDEETNQHISQVVENLDRPVPQVLIKVLFVEVTHSNELDLGLEGFIQRRRTYDFSAQVDTHSWETIFGLGAETTGGFYQIIKEDLNLTLRALAEVAKLEVLSRPSILTRNNAEAVITVGQELPFITNSRITQDGQTINTVEYQDIGIILRVTPHISEDRLVAMDVEPEITTLTAQTVPISNTVNAPVIAKRAASTSVVVPDGSTVVIGGLMEDNKTKSKRKIPILGDIPILGAAFSRTVNSKSKTELLIFLTPHVVEGAGELETMSVSERRKSELAPKAFPGGEVDRFLDAVRTDPVPDSAPPLVPSSAQSPAPESASSSTAESRGAEGQGRAQRPGNKGVVYRSKR